MSRVRRIYAQIQRPVVLAERLGDAYMRRIRDTSYTETNHNDIWDYRPSVPSNILFLVTSMA